MRILVFGAGYSGQALGRMAAGCGARIAGTTRKAENAERLRRAGIAPLIFDGEAVSQDLRAELETATHLVISAGPGPDGDPVLRAAGGLIEKGMPALRWIGYLSTVGVYGDHEGAWVDEATACNPVSARSKQRLDVENAWMALGERTGKPTAILRLAGIYGPGRNAFVNLAEGRARRIVKKNQIFNRIHVDDIAGALLHLMRTEAGGIVNVTDDEPAPPQDVVEYAAALMGVEPPPEIPFEEAEMTPMARSFYGENKRVSNARLKAAGYRLLYPDYMTAFDAMWRDGRWKAP